MNSRINNCLFEYTVVPRLTTIIVQLFCHNVGQLLSEAPLYSGASLNECPVEQLNRLTRGSGLSEYRITKRGEQLIGGSKMAAGRSAPHFRALPSLTEGAKMAALRDNIA